MVLGVGQSRIPPNLIGSIAIFPSSTIIPRYSTQVLLNSQFNASKKRLFSRNLCNTSLVYRSRSSSVLAKIKMSSMYMMTIHPSILSMKIASIIAWKVAGELHAKEHDHWFEKSLIGFKSGFPFVSPFDTDVVVS